MLILSVPHASEETAAGDHNSLAIANKLHGHVVSSQLLRPLHEGVLIARTAETDYNRSHTPWPELEEAMADENAKLLDIHTYGKTVPKGWEDGLKKGGTTPILIVMLLEGNEQRTLYEQYFSAYPWIKGSSANRNVQLHPERSLLLEFNSDALHMEDEWQGVLQAVAAYAAGRPLTMHDQQQVERERDADVLPLRYPVAAGTNLLF